MLVVESPIPYPLYAADTWVMTAAQQRFVDSVQQRILRTVFRIRPRRAVADAATGGFAVEYVSNEEVLERTGVHRASRLIAAAMARTLGSLVGQRGNPYARAMGAEAEGLFALGVEAQPRHREGGDDTRSHGLPARGSWVWRAVSSAAEFGVSSGTLVHGAEWRSKLRLPPPSFVEAHRPDESQQ